jgi:hypothetical protein
MYVGQGDLETDAGRTSLGPGNDLETVTWKRGAEDACFSINVFESQGLRTGEGRK